MSSIRKLGTGILVVLALISGSAAELDSEINQSCDADYEPLISMPDPTSETSNPGKPGLYQYQVCVRGIESSSFSTSCPENVGFYISSKDTDAHFSTQNSYNWHVCTGSMKTRVTTGSKFENETALFSVSDTHNAHVAEPGYYDYNVYGVYASPNNVTLSIEFNLSSSDEVYFDGESVDGEAVYYPPADFPAMISESGSYVAGVISRDFLKAERVISGENRLSLTSKGASSFLVPFTSEDYSGIEEQEDEIMNGEFIGIISPNFGFRTVDDPLVKVVLKRDDIESDLSLAPGDYRFNVTKTGEDQVEIVETE